MTEKILIVEDTEDILEGLTIAFTEEGFEVVGAGRGEEAFDHLSRFDPDIILLDVHLPGLTGVEILKEIRGALDVPVLMFTSSGDKAIVQEALEAGATNYVLKDTGMDELVQRVRRCIVDSQQETSDDTARHADAGLPDESDQPDEPEERESLPEAGAGRPPLILYIGRDTAVDGLITDSARRMAAESARISRPSMALASMEDWRPTVIVLDLEQEDTDGVRVVKSLQQNAISEGIPVVMVAGHASPEVRRSAVRHGSHAFFKKPINEVDFELTMQKLLRLARKKLAA